MSPPALHDKQAIFKLQFKMMTFLTKTRRQREFADKILHPSVDSLITEKNSKTLEKPGF